MKLLLPTVAVVFLATLSQAATPAVSLAGKARAALGGDTALNAVQSLRIEMSVADAAGASVGSVISEYKSPMKQRELNYTEKNIEVVAASDGREGFRMIRHLDNNATRLQVIPYEEMNARRDITTANLRLLAAPGSDRGTLTVGADESVDGVVCATLEYAYKSGVIIRRYIEKTTGRLAATRIGATGPLMINVGEQKVAGINFPKSIVIRDDKGKTQRTLTLAKIEVNSTLDDASFAMPRL